MQVQENYIKARDNGTLEDAMPQLINDAVGAIVSGYEETAIASAAAYEASLKNKEGNEETGPFSNLSADSRVTLGYFRNKASQIPVKEGMSAHAMDENGELKTLPDGTPNPKFDGKISQYVVGKYNKEGVFVPSLNYNPIPVGNDKDFVRIIGLK
jgi:hypothetical protein